MLHIFVLYVACFNTFLCLCEFTLYVSFLLSHSQADRTSIPEEESDFFIPSAEVAQVARELDNNPQNEVCSALLQ